MNPNEIVTSQAPDSSALPYGTEFDTWVTIQNAPELDTETPSSVVQTQQPEESDVFSSRNHSAGKVEDVVQTYMKLNRIFFGWGVYLLIFIIGWIIAWRFSLPDTSIPFPMRDEAILSQEQAIRQEINVISEEESRVNDIFVIVKQGDLSLRWNKLFTINNLVTYKWFTLPQKTSINVLAWTGELQKSSHFVAWLHTSADIDSYLSKIIYNNYVPLPDITSTNAKTWLLSTFYPLDKYFGVQCLLYPRPFGNIFCDKALEATLPSLSVYILANHYDELIVLAQRIKDTPNEELFCDAIKQYLFLSNDTNASIKEVMTICGPKYSSVFSEFSSFRTIQDQLSKQSIQSNVTTSAVLNSYKLVSVMQEIYSEVKRGNNINELRIGSYIDYIRSLLKNRQALQWFYMDIIARYNNTFLSPLLADKSVSTRGEISTIYRKLLLELNELNEGNMSKGFTWLMYLVSDQNLTIVSSSGYIDDTLLSWELLLSDIFTQSYSFANYIVMDLDSPEPDKIHTTGVLRFSQDIGLANNTPLSIIFSSKNQRFYAESITLPRHPGLEAAINPRLAVTPLSISELYDLIIKTHTDIPTTTTSTDVCQSFKQDKDMVSCTGQVVKFIKKRVTYIFEYSREDGVSQYSISDPQLDSAIKALYGISISLTKNPVEAITIVLNYKEDKPIEPDDTPSNLTWGLQEVLLQRNYTDVWSTVTKITPTDTYYIVEFQNNGYTFKSVYDTEKQTILWLGLMIRGTTYAIRNFVFDFANVGASEKTLFKNDIKTLLLQFDPLTTNKRMK